MLNVYLKLLELRAFILLRNKTTLWVFLFLGHLLFTQRVCAQLFSKERIQNIPTFDQQFLSWGYFLGFNSCDFNFDYHRDLKDIQVEKSLGFNVGLVGDMRVNKYLNLRFEPGLYIVKRNLIFHPEQFVGMDSKPADFLREVNSTYVQLPILLKISTERINNFKPFIIGGVSTAINLSSRERDADDNFNGQFRTKKNAMFYELGFGIDLYFYWFKFSPSIRGVFALSDELVKDRSSNSPWTDNISSMQTRGVFINFTFQ